MAKEQINIRQLKTDSVLRKIELLKKRCSRCFAVGPTTRGLCDAKCYPDYRKEQALARVGQEFLDTNGYTRVYVLVDDEVKMRYKHRVLKVEEIGRELTPQETVIFADGDKNNLQLSNLVVALKGGIPLEDLICPHCGIPRVTK